MIKLIFWGGGIYLAYKFFGGGGIVGKTIKKAITGGQALTRIPTYLPLFRSAAAKYGMDLVTLISIGWKESNLDPNALSSDGQDHGLMQINRKAHAAWFPDHDWRDPGQNIDKGASVLAEAYAYFRKQGLTGSLLDRTAIAAYNTGAGNVAKSLSAGKDPDATTTGKDYGSDVLARRSLVSPLVV